MTDTFNLLHQLEEDEAELKRHHRDFEAIRKILDRAEADDNLNMGELIDGYRNDLKNIRSIVG